MLDSSQFRGICHVVAVGAVASAPPLKRALTPVQQQSTDVATLCLSNANTDIPVSWTSSLAAQSARTREPSLVPLAQHYHCGRVYVRHQPRGGPWTPLESPLEQQSIPHTVLSQIAVDNSNIPRSIASSMVLLLCASSLITGAVSRLIPTTLPTTSISECATKKCQPIAYERKT